MINLYCRTKVIYVCVCFTGLLFIYLIVAGCISIVGYFWLSIGFDSEERGLVVVVEGFNKAMDEARERSRNAQNKMEKSEEFALHSASYSSQRLHMNVSSATKNCGTSHAVRMFSSEKPHQSPASSGGFQPSSRLGHEQGFGMSNMQVYG